MSLLYRIVYAAHANGTHHKLALDAVAALSVPAADAWQKLFLANAEGYLTGAKDPDKVFKDFKNHVLHVGDDYWGGAIGKVEEWYRTTVDRLAAGQWPEAVYAAGVLSHYYTDPIHPFHTAQSEAENSIHRAAEWSINRSYDQLARIGAGSNRRMPVEVKDGDGWLRDLVCAGAELSHAQYEKLIAHYDIHKGVVDPPAGLDMLAQALVADLIDYAGRSFAVILDRAIAESKAAPPSVSLTVETFLATVKIPKKWIAKKLANAEDRRVVEAMYDELRTTGRVDQTLPEDDRTVRDLYAAEVLAPRRAARDSKRAALVGATTPRPASREPEPRPQIHEAPAAAPAPSLAARLDCVAPSAVPAIDRETSQLEAMRATPAPGQASAPAAASTTSVPPAGQSPAPKSPVEATAVQAPPLKPPAVASTPTPTPTPTPSRAPAPPQSRSPVLAPLDSAEADRRAPREPRIYLAAGDPLEAAPSMGPKGAERFASFGIKTVADFLAGDAKTIADKLAVRQVTPEVIATWQAQARLVMGVPGLRGTHAQLLCGAGLRTVQAIASADSDAVCAAVLKYATSPEGQRLLRDGPPPDVARIKSWCDSARAALAA